MHRAQHRGIMNKIKWIFESVLFTVAMSGAVEKVDYFIETILLIFAPLTKFRSNLVMLCS